MENQKEASQHQEEARPSSTSIDSSKQHQQENKELSSKPLDGDRIPANISEQDRQMLRDKMKQMFAKLITDIDNQVLTVNESQNELDSQLDRLISTLNSIKIDEKLTDDISANAKRISSLKSRLTLIHTILSNSSARCSRTLAACGAAVSSLSSTGATN